MADDRMILYSSEEFLAYLDWLGSHPSDKTGTEIEAEAELRPWMTADHKAAACGDEWAAFQERVTQKFLRISADEFRRRFRAGDYHDDAPFHVETVFGFFPELDG